jgi:hypothetical protein
LRGTELLTKGLEGRRIVVIAIHVTAGRDSRYLYARSQHLQGTIGSSKSFNVS